jgi:5,10-methylenetetrahydrofolate reductase
VQKAPAPQGFVNERERICFALFPASGSGETFLYKVLTELKKSLLPGVEAVSAANLVQRRKHGRAARSEQPYASGRRNCGGGDNIRDVCR